MFELKFRVWDKQIKTWVKDYFDDEYQWTLSFNGEFVYSLKNHRTIKCNNWEITQYTGLKDKDKKEIFEGDILNVTLNSWIGCKKPHKAIVKYKDGCFICYGITTYFEFVFKDLEVEVIGNIYENPELLKGE